MQVPHNFSRYQEDLFCRLLGEDYSTRCQKKNTTRRYTNVLLYGKVRVYLICHRPAQGARLFLITNRIDLNPIVALYKVRWSIETAFGMGVLSVCLLWGHLQQKSYRH
ncbi:MAG: hypothetical protein ACI906_000427 [Candidatus Latescibacterota bacterium]|jgi:hypothetical protein